MARKATKKAAKKRPAVDSRGRLIGNRAHREPPGDGLIEITRAERDALRAVANRAVEENTLSAFARAMALDVGEWDVATGGSVQSLAMSLSQAKKRGELKGRKFEYGTTTAVFKTSDKDGGSKYANVLWVIRTK